MELMSTTCTNKKPRQHGLHWFASGLGNRADPSGRSPCSAVGPGYLYCATESTQKGSVDDLEDPRKYWTVYAGRVDGSGDSVMFDSPGDLGHVH